MEKLGFSQCEVDQAVFLRRAGKKLIIVLVHVDDCTIIANAQPLITQFKIEIAKHVDITDLGDLSWQRFSTYTRNTEFCSRNAHTSTQLFSAMGLKI